MNPQALNRYSYCINNPLKYIDPSGHFSQEDLMEMYNTGAIDEDMLSDLWEVASSPEENTIVMSSWTGIEVGFDETIRVWRSSFVSDITGGRIGRTNVVTYRFTGHVSYDSSNNYVYLSLYAYGKEYFNDLLNPAYLLLRPSVLK
jgi:hypothetical protein